MMAEYTIDTTLHAGTSATIELPDGKVWDDVDSWFIKWDTLYVLFKGEDETIEINLNSNVDDIIDWKRPLSVSIFKCYENGETDYSTEIDSTDD